MKHSTRPISCLLLSVVLSTSLLTGCSKKEVDAPQSTATISASATSVVLTATPTATILPTEAPTPVAKSTTAPVASLSSTQRNSINMLNWLAYLTQEINSESNNRVFIESIYSLIVNETYPNAVDTHTQDRLKGIRQALVRYRMVDVKRERIEFLYEQNKAQAIKAAIPSPLALMTAVQSGSLAKVATSVVYMAINSISSYHSAVSQAELQYLQEGWDLDDEATEVFYNLRSDAFDYMIDIVREYDLPGYLALNEKAVEEFVYWKGKSDVNRRILFLENNVETYQAFGSYWLLLAESYYSIGDYTKCLDAIHSYEALSTRIFRKDNEYAKVLPLAIVAAENTLSQDEFIPIAEQYAKDILNNISTEDWALRYYAAQTYVNLYAKTRDTSYLWNAHDALLNNVNYLVDEQTAMNATYIAKVQEETVPAGSTKDEEAQIKSYNNLLKEKRKTELPPVSEPLLLNCDLLFAVGNQLGLSSSEQKKIDNVLHANGEQLFLINELDNQYRYNGKIDIDSNDFDHVEYNGKELKIPVSFVSDNASISVKVTDSEGAETVFDDWTISAVNRQTEGSVSTYIAVFKSTTAEKYAYKPGDHVCVSVIPHQEYVTTPTVIDFEAVNNKPNWYDHISFWNSDLAFEKVD